MPTPERYIDEKNFENRMLKKIDKRFERALKGSKDEEEKNQLEKRRENFLKLKEDFELFTETIELNKKEKFRKILENVFAIDTTKRKLEVVQDKDCVT